MKMISLIDYHKRTVIALNTEHIEAVDMQGEPPVTYVHLRGGRWFSVSESAEEIVRRIME